MARGRWVVAVALAAIAASLTLATRPAEAATATSTALATSANPAAIGEDITYTAVVTVPGQPGGVVDSGTVSFTATGLTTCSSQPVSGGRATCVTDWSTVPDKSVTAIYSGDATWSTSTSAALTQRVTSRGNLFTLTPTLDQTCGTFHDYAFPSIAGVTKMTVTARGGTGGVSDTNTNGTPAPGQGGVAHADGIAYKYGGSTHLAYQVGCGGGSAAAGQGTPANGGAGWGDGGSGGTPGTSGPRGGGGGGGSAACLSTAVNHMCESGIPLVVAGGGGGTGPGVHYGGGGGGAGGGAAGGSRGGGCGDTPPTAGTNGSSWAGPLVRWYSIASKPGGFTVGGSGGGGAGCGSNKGGAGGGGGGGTGGAGGDRCCAASSGGTG
ncbi:MAG: Ig-like domain (Group 3), partial [Ilumatobacteraceae bacterium]|nr:Ig-like domain (Group 3) [Ilumatobacteraceae bacterium]